MPATEPQRGYAPIDGLRMYHEIHGRGRPLVLLHGAFMTIDLMGPLLPALAETRQVIAAEQQGHGRSAGVDRPLSYEQMADDTAALMRHLQTVPADIFGYSMGAGVALQLAIRHPDLVRKLVLASASFTSDGMHAAALALFPALTAELFAGSPVEQAYLQTAPNPGEFPTFVAKVKQLITTPYAWPEQDIRAIAAPALIVVGDSDGIRLEHAIELFGLLGGGVMGDLEAMPRSQLAVLPGTTHREPPGQGLLDRTQWLLAMVVPFLDAPMPGDS